ncbi:MAG: hypothetical protein Q4C85_11260, partial [Actinomyces sp.]|uniref:hypothetical protein n=1 Tax=Actinomyces sp. TaxID=29317 RepID=UPI0026DC0385
MTDIATGTAGSRDQAHEAWNLTERNQPAYPSPVALKASPSATRARAADFLGVLFENSIVCHVFYAML